MVLFGQVDFIVFAGLFAAYALLKRDRYGLAGLALALVLFKPQMLAGVVLMLLLAYRILNRYLPAYTQRTPARSRARAE